jgi:pyruvate/2-oxoglutarate dehydrogenase complex dihydrolipoamide dehydrogenase (E3) component
MSHFEFPLVVIGAGAGGLVIAIGMAKLGKSVLLIERGSYGGDCTNYGCIPSKSLIASAHAAQAIRDASTLGLKLTSTEFSAVGAMRRVRQIVQKIRHSEEPPQLQKIGVSTLTGVASFEDKYTLKVVEATGAVHSVKAQKIVIAAGSAPRLPTLKGLETVPYFTNETIFDLEDIPSRLAVLGGGPIGCELGQAFQRLGSSVIIVQSGNNLLEKEEQESQCALKTRLEQEGTEILLNHTAQEVTMDQGQILLKTRRVSDNTEYMITASHLLVAIGRRPNIDALHLEAADVNYTSQGIIVDGYGRTTQRHIWAIGDIAGGPLFTHVAENQARTVLKNLFLPAPFKKRLDRRQAVPRVTYTDPEIASVGLLEKQAIQRYGASRIAIYTVPFDEVDRAITAGRTEGFVKIVTKKWSSKILGATIVAPRAGEMLSELTTAMHKNIPLRKLASLIHPYPTYSLAIRKAADQWLTKTLLQTFHRRSKKQ